jgi:hypothetical protein
MRRVEILLPEPLERASNPQSSREHSDTVEKSGARRTIHYQLATRFDMVMARGETLRHVRDMLQNIIENNEVELLIRAKAGWENASSNLVSVASGSSGDRLFRLDSERMHTGSGSHIQEPTVSAADIADELILYRLQRGEHAEDFGKIVLSQAFESAEPRPFEERRSHLIWIKARAKNRAPQAAAPAVEQPGFDSFEQVSSTSGTR